MPEQEVRQRLIKNLIDSPTLLEIVCEIEDNFDLEIDDEQTPELRSFGEDVTNVNEMVQTRQQTSSNVAHISFNASYLAGKKKIISLLILQGRP